ncbi:HGGxSTG domain-containing protein [Paenibacillus dendritiformis]|uniref:HGGxSTG domain-containing protein n=1 Tax=Paenibacillus dendritiformis TaxID=130049 RepID=UPI0018CC9D54|nr:HGGxSTG domain-containing protein [Paenibacillus dendritiformis]
MEKKLCGAKTRNGEPCKKAALANGRCRLHGGKSTGPKDRTKLKGNKNALKHGLYETIWLDTLTDEERQLYARVSTDPTAQVENEFKLSDIRIRRMLQRIKQEEEKDKPNQAAIRAIEEAITKVQMNKAALIRENSRLVERNGTESDGALDQLAVILEQARKKYQK